MKVTIVNNGVTSIILIPENELEKLQLKEFSSKKIEMLPQEQNVQILNNPAPNALVLKGVKLEEKGERLDIETN